MEAAAPEQHLNGFRDPVLRERVRITIPWHRDVVDVLAEQQPLEEH